jgi:hypothetical protein
VARPLSLYEFILILVAFEKRKNMFYDKLGAIPITANRVRNN